MTFDYDFAYNFLFVWSLLMLKLNEINEMLQEWREDFFP